MITAFQIMLLFVIFIGVGAQLSKDVDKQTKYNLIGASAISILAFVVTIILV